MIKIERNNQDTSQITDSIVTARVTDLIVTARILQSNVNYGIRESKHVMIPMNLIRNLNLIKY